jgi:hypothetical protein
MEAFSIQMVSFPGNVIFPAKKSDLSFFFFFFFSNSLSLV